MRRRFRKFTTWHTAVYRTGAKARRVTKAKTNWYWQAIRGGTIIGFFNLAVLDGESTKFGYGELDTSIEEIPLHA
jgi:hypothetical protein